MKVNFWQALGVVLVVIGVIFYVRGKISKNDTVDPATHPPALTQPAATPDDAADATTDAAEQ